MIVTCASCMTKFSLDESRIPAKGAKVRCSKCQHVFFVSPPTGPKEEEPREDFESFLKSQKEFAEPAAKGKEIPPPKMGKWEKAEFPAEDEGLGLPEEEEEAIFGEGAPGKKKAPVTSFEPEGAERPEPRPIERKRGIRRERTKLPITLLVSILVVLLVVGGFFLWTEFGSKQRMAAYIDYPIQKARALWEEILGMKKEGLVVVDLNRHDEKVGDALLSVIEGKVKNQSSSARKHIKIRVQIFDQNKDKIAEKQTFCGLNIGIDGLRSLPAEFFEGEMLIQPQQSRDMILPPGKETPFMVVFKDLTGQAKEFKVEIIEAPNL